MRERRSRCWTVSEGEGNKARGDRRQGIGATHSTLEAREVAPEDPARKGVAVLWNLKEGKMTGTSKSESISPRLQRVADLSRQAPDMVWTTLAHHIDFDLLKEAHRQVRKDGALGVDGQTAEEYSANLEENLESLLNRFKSGSYKAPPVRRASIPKGDEGKKRTIGIPTFEDKILQRAVTMVLEAVYEQDFLDCSYGFRPHRSAHQALDTFWRKTMWMGGGYVLKLDIEKYFDMLDHKQLRAILDKRVRDGVIRRTINKWLKAGILHENRGNTGTPQGGVISPLLANVFLHEVLDTWFEKDVRPRLEEDAFLIRYADDATLVFSLKRDAEKVWRALSKRLQAYGLRMHPEKTRLIRFTRPGPNSRKTDRSHPGTFDLLGFTHYWGKSRKQQWVIKRKTAKDRFSRSLRNVSDWCRKHRHLDIVRQQEMLALKLKGHYRYFGITGNMQCLSHFYLVVKRNWRRWLNRRSQKGRMPWERFLKLLQRYPLPKPKIFNSAVT